MLYVISYDIPDDGRRTRVADTLKDFGRRVQYSVFEALLDEALRAQLEHRLGGILALDEDSVRLYAICAECEPKLRIMGLGTRTVEQNVYVV